MGKITHFVAQSLDGFIEGPNGEFDWPVMDAELSAYARSLTADCDAFLYGRKVWDGMSGYWPRAEVISTDPHDLAFAPIWRRHPKIVVSRTLQKADWNTRVIGENVVEELTALKESGTDMLMFGGSELAAHLTEHGLIDEYQITVHPTVLRGGRPAFQPAKERVNVRLIEARTFDSQVVLMRYARATAD
ncbi:dihydrofolate reductase family protein [Streptomyces tailanensis]|uniref:dihydrofolate reductase family protein n=1 Tax=Streptomyces tailanensis TaxID=2569858 RepID=UPI00122E7983|nr:dihydrofolate reductase family protein [Streptomyces tailanensis]